MPGLINSLSEIEEGSTSVGITVAIGVIAKSLGRDFQTMYDEFYPIAKADADKRRVERRKKERDARRALAELELEEED